MRLGEGTALSLSPGGKWVLAYPSHPEPAQLILLPTGPGESRPLTHDFINHTAGWWFPDGKRVLFVGTEPGHAARAYVQDVEGGKPRPITPEGVELGSVAVPVSPNGKFVAVLGADRNWSLFPVDGGQPRRIPGVESNDQPVQWAADGTSLYVRRVRDPRDWMIQVLWRLRCSGSSRML